jgi:putative oxidoreductase
MQHKVAERVAYGTPLDPVADDTPIHLVPRSGSALIGRILISAIFIVSGFAKLTDPAGAMGYMTAAGVPHSDLLVYVAGCAELLGGAAILLGFLTRLAALGLFVFLVITTYFFHHFWNMSGAEAKAQMVQFMKNLAVMGGLLTLFAHGPGRLSIDARLRRPKEA